jgi:hypothetical protein
VTEEQRTCKDCGELKPLDQLATYKKGGETKYMWRCKDCHRLVERERQRRYISKNRAAHNRRSRDNKRKRYNEDPEYRAKIRAESKEYYEVNKEEVLSKRMERYHEPFEPRKLASRDSHRTYEEEFEDALAETWRTG